MFKIELAGLSKEVKFYDGLFSVRPNHQHFDDFQNRPNHYSFRRFIKATGNTPLEYAQRIKIESAKKEFETSRKKINEVMYEVGYVDVKALREVFRKITGMSPLEYRNKYNREAAVLQAFY